ncbi:MAG: NUMOD4 motif-containing HNH endonuclease [Bacteroidales bacterium]|nr:NUMOD4 motif-containing HNH endonuclease [Bacteroidales bacterium]
MIEKRKLRKIEDEEWRFVPASGKRYQVSNYGRVKSFVNNKKDGQVLKCALINGFKLVQLNTEKFKRKVYVHKLVAEIWLPKPSDKHTFVTHLDGNLKNNQVANLEWHTRESLVERHREMAKKKYGDARNPGAIKNSKLEESDIMLLKSMLQRGVVQAKIAKLFRISEMQVTRIKRGENWGHVQPLKIEE